MLSTLNATIQPVTDIPEITLPTQENKPEMLRTLDSFNNLLESATNWLFFGKFTPTSSL